MRWFCGSSLNGTGITKSNHSVHGQVETLGELCHTFFVETHWHQLNLPPGQVISLGHNVSIYWTYFSTSWKKMPAIDAPKIACSVGGKTVPWHSLGELEPAERNIISPWTWGKMKTFPMTEKFTGKSWYEWQRWVGLLAGTSVLQSTVDV